LSMKFGKMLLSLNDMKFPDHASELVSLALKTEDVYSAAAVYVVATGESKRKLETVMFSKRRDALLLARWEHTPASVLAALSGKSDRAIASRLDKNPNSSNQVLSKLYLDKRDLDKRSTNKGGLNKSGLNKGQLDIAEADKTSTSLKVLIAQHQHVSLDVLKFIAHFDSDVASLLAVSKNPKADTALLSFLLRRFAIHPMLDILQKNVAENPSASADILEHLYVQGDEYVKAAVIGHRHCSQGLIDKAWQEESVLIKRQLAADKRLPVANIVSLSRHSDNAVRCAVASNELTPKPVIKRLLADASAAVRRAIAARSDLTMTHISRLINDPDIWVRQKLARNLITPNKVLAKLAVDINADVRRGVARNSQCPLRLLKLLAEDESSWVRAAVAYQYKTPRQLLEILAQDSDIDVLSGVAHNPNTAQSLLKKLAASVEADVRRGVILNQNATRITLLPLLEDAYYLHRLMLVANSKLRDRDKWHLCFDPDSQVRFAAFGYFANHFVKSSD
jgi:hypothetical protein